MAQLELILGNNVNRIDLAASTLADNAIAQFGAAQLVIARDVLSGVLNLPISSLQTDPLRAEFQASQELKWNFSLPAGASLQITLDPSVSASIELRRSGELFATAGSITLDDDLPLEPPAAPKVQPGSAYVSIRLKVSLTAAAQGSFTHGAFGFKVNAGTEQKFLLAYHHRVAPETPVGDAIRDAFQHFVLPYTPEGAGRIRQGCFSEWEHISKFDGGFEATAGFGGALLGAKSASELARTVSSDLGTVAVGIQPKFQVGASFTVSYEHADAFRSVLSAPVDAEVDLFIYKMDSSQLSVGLTIGASAKLNATVRLETRLEEVTKEALNSVIPANLPRRDDLIAQLLKTLPAGDLDKATAEAEKAIQDFINSLDKLTAEASITTERIGQNEALLICRFHKDGQGALPALFADAFQGRLRIVAAAERRCFPGRSCATPCAAPL